MDSGTDAVAASPAQLILQALAGCTLMDCVHIFTRARNDLKKLWIDVKAEEAETHPRVYSSVHLTYHITSSDITDAEADRAIRLSGEKYCRVHAMLSDKVKITFSFVIERP